MLPTDAARGDEWIDISRPLSERTEVWPGDHRLVLHQETTDTMVVSWVETTCHVGTHVDAPLHLDPNAAPVDGIPLQRLLGHAEVVRVARQSERVTRDCLPDGWRPQTQRVLIRTDSQPLGAQIGPGFSGLDPDLVHWLSSTGVFLVGVDTPSVDPFAARELTAHLALVERGVTWIEGLWLENADAGLYDLVALPILLVGAEAAPVRAVVRPI